MTIQQAQALRDTMAHNIEALLMAFIEQTGLIVHSVQLGGTPPTIKVDVRVQI